MRAYAVDTSKMNSSRSALHFLNRDKISREGIGLPEVGRKQSALSLLPSAIFLSHETILPVSRGTPPFALMGDPMSNGAVALGSSRSSLYYYEIWNGRWGRAFCTVNAVRARVQTELRRERYISHCIFAHKHTHTHTQRASRDGACVSDEWCIGRVHDLERQQLRHSHAHTTHPPRSSQLTGTRCRILPNTLVTILCTRFSPLYSLVRPGRHNRNLYRSPIDFARMEKISKGRIVLQIQNERLSLSIFTGNCRTNEINAL